MIKLLSAILAVALGATGAQAATYLGERSIGTATADISITTDDTLGVLTADNILDWSIVLRSATGNATLFGPESGDTSRVELSGTALSATATDLLFNFSAPGQAYLLFQSTLGDRSLYCVQTVNCFDQNRGEEIISLGSTFTDFQRDLRTGSVSIANVTPSVPEPATWAMMLVGFGAVGLGMRRRQPDPKPVRVACA